MRLRAKTSRLGRRMKPAAILEAGVGPSKVLEPRVRPREVPLSDVRPWPHGGRVRYRYMNHTTGQEFDGSIPPTPPAPPAPPAPMTKPPTQDEERAFKVAALRRQRAAGGGNPDISDEGILEEYQSALPKQYASNSPEGQRAGAATMNMLKTLSQRPDGSSLTDTLAKAHPAISSVGVSAHDFSQPWNVAYAITYDCMDGKAYPSIEEIKDAVDAAALTDAGPVKRVRPLIIKMRRVTEFGPIYHMTQHRGDKEGYAYFEP